MNQLTESNPGLHCLLIYDDLTTLREFYSYYIQRQVEEKKEMVFVNPFYETTDLVRETLATGYKSINIEKYENKEKRLVIVDSLKKYQGKKSKTRGIAKEVGIEEIEQINKSKEKESNKKTTYKIKDSFSWWSYNQQMINYAKKVSKTTLSILADVGAFYFMGKSMELFEYECSLPEKFDQNTKAFCIYNQKDFDILTDEQKQKLAKHHDIAIKIEIH